MAKTPSQTFIRNELEEWSRVANMLATRCWRTGESMNMKMAAPSPMTTTAPRASLRRQSRLMIGQAQARPARARTPSSAMYASHAPRE
ncbi:hypothetical protein D3C72_2320660 [compost metagenome]